MLFMHAHKLCKSNKKTAEMKTLTPKIYALAAVAALMCLVSLSVSAQEKKPETPDLNEIAEQEADRLERVLDLEAWQTFYVDSTLKHNWAEMTREFDSYRESKIANTSLYQEVQDRWNEKTDELYKRIFTEEQWAKYLKQGGKAAIKAREKRKAKLVKEKKAKK